MQSAFENLLADQEKRRNDFMEQFYKKYTLTEGDSDDELIDFRTSTVIKKKGKLRRKCKRKSVLKKRVKTKVIKFGEMSSYSISIESKTCLKQIRMYIESNEAYTEKFFQQNDGEESELLVTSNIFTRQMKRDSFKDDKWPLSKKIQNKILALNCASNQPQPSLSISTSIKFSPGDAKLDCLTFEQDKDIKNSTKSIKNVNNSLSKIPMLPVYSPFFKYNSKLDTLHEDQTVKNISEHEIHQKSSETKCDDLCLKPSNNALVAKTDDNNLVLTYELKDCSVVLSKIWPANNVKFLESKSDGILSQSIPISPKFNSPKKSIPINQNDKHAQKPSQKKSTGEKMHFILKRLQPYFPKTTGTSLKLRSSSRYLLEVDEIKISCNEDKQQNNSNLTVYRPHTNANLKPRNLFTDTCLAKNVGNQNKSLDTNLTIKSSNNIDQTDLDTTLCITNCASVSSQTIFQYSDDEQLMPEDRQASLVDDWKNKSLEVNDCILKRGNISPNTDLSLLENFDAIHSSSVFPSTAKNALANIPSSKYVLENSFVSVNSDGSHDQCSSSSDMCVQHNFDSERFSCISKDKFAAKASKHSNIKSCKKNSRKLSTDESEGENNCAKLDNSEADFIKSKKLHLSQKCATFKSGAHPVSRSKHKVSYSKKEFQKISSNDVGQNPGNVPNKDTSTPKIIDCHRPRKLSTPKEGPGAEISDNRSKKVASTPKVLKKYSRLRSIFSPNTYPAENISHTKSISVTKLNRKYLRRSGRIKFSSEFNESQNDKQREILANSQNNSFDYFHGLRKKSVHLESPGEDELLGISEIPHKQFFTPQFPKRLLRMRPLSESRKLKSNLLVDCLVQN